MKTRRLSRKKRSETTFPRRNLQPPKPKKSGRGLLSPSDEGPRDPGQPLWMHEGRDLEKLPLEIRQAAEEIVRPAYEQLVLHAAPGLERSLGTSLVHLLWLEILDQFDLKRDYATFNLVLDLPSDRQQSIDNHIRLLDAKLRHGRFMLRLEEFRRQRQSASPIANRQLSDAPPPSDSLPLCLDPVTLLPLQQAAQEKSHA